MLSKENLEKLKNLNWQIVSKNPFKAVRYTQFAGTHELNSEKEAIEDIESSERFKKISEEWIQKRYKETSKPPRIVSDKEILDWLEKNVKSLVYKDSQNKNKTLKSGSIRGAVVKEIQSGQNN